MKHAMKILAVFYLITCSTDAVRAESAFTAIGQVGNNTIWYYGSMLSVDNDGYNGITFKWHAKANFTTVQNPAAVTQTFSHNGTKHLFVDWTQTICGCFWFESNLTSPSKFFDTTGGTSNLDVVEPTHKFLTPDCS